MMEILEKIHVVKMRTQVLEIIISFMIPYSLTHLSRLLDKMHFIVVGIKQKLTEKILDRGIYCEC
jgi:hypothetical protein